MASEVTKQLSWAEVKDLVQRGTTTDVEALGLLGRSPEALAVYRAYRAQVLQEYASVTDNLRARLFGAPTTRNADGKLAVASPDPTEASPYLLVMANEFPYYLEPGISHFNIWCSSRDLPDEVVERLIAERLPSEEHVWFVNPPQFQSIRAIWHCHVMLRDLKPSAKVGKPGQAELFQL